MPDSFWHMVQSCAFPRKITKPRQPISALSTILNVSITMQIGPLSYAMGCRFPSEILSLVALKHFVRNRLDAWVRRISEMP